MQLLDIHEPGETPLVNEGKASVGIDLGTTNSLVAISNNGIQEIVCDKNNEALLPSIVTYKENGDVVVGKADDGVVIRSVKRLMGKSLDDVETVAGVLPYELDHEIKEGMVHLKVADRSITPVEVSAEILKTLKNRAEIELENEVDRAVITVPAYFDDAARAATRDAAKIAGIEVLRLVNEPTAAALAYGLDNDAEGLYIVYDFGGGTFDVSVLKMHMGVFQVLATGGDSALGGDDIDAALAEYIIKEHDLLVDSSSIIEVLLFARKIKEHLTDNDKYEEDITLLGKEISCKITNDKFNELAEQYVDRTIKICQNILVDSGVKRDEIKEIILVGGSTRMPLVYGKVEEFYGKKPLSSIDPDKVVAVGAAIQAEALSQGSNTLLLDVNPLSLGIETMGGIVETIIPRNSPIPTSYSEKFTTGQDNQTGIMIHVLQGEREMVDHCRSLAQFELANLPAAPAGKVIIEVIFTLDADGLLVVSAKTEDSDDEQVIEIKPSYGLPAEKIEQMLRDSMENAKGDILRRLLEQSRIDATLVINAVNAALEQDGNLIEAQYITEINKQVELLNKLIKGDDRDAIDYEVIELEKISGNFIEKRVNRSIKDYLEGVNIDEIEEA